MSSRNTCRQEAAGRKPHEGLQKPPMVQLCEGVVQCRRPALPFALVCFSKCEVTSLRSSDSKRETGFPFEKCFLATGDEGAQRAKVQCRCSQWMSS